MYRLGTLIRKLDAMLCKIHLFKVAAPHGLKLAQHDQKLVAAVHVIIQQLYFALRIELNVLVISCFRIFVAIHLGVSVA